MLQSTASLGKDDDESMWIINFSKSNNVYLESAANPGYFLTVSKQGKYSLKPLNENKFPKGASFSLIKSGNNTLTFKSKAWNVYMAPEPHSCEIGASWYSNTSSQWNFEFYIPTK